MKQHCQLNTDQLNQSQVETPTVLGTVGTMLGTPLHSSMYRRVKQYQLSQSNILQTVHNVDSGAVERVSDKQAKRAKRLLMRLNAEGEAGEKLTQDLVDGLKQVGVEPTTPEVSKCLNSAYSYSQGTPEEAPPLKKRRGAAKDDADYDY